MSSSTDERTDGVSLDGENDAMSAESELVVSFRKVVERRTSIRAFRPDPVPRPILHDAFTLAGRSASNANTQPWRVFVASGSTLQRLGAALMADAEADRYSADFDYDPSVYTDVYSMRQGQHGMQMLEAVGVARDDKLLRRKVVMRNMKFYGAPHVAFLFMPSFGGVREAGDVSLFAQTLMLALTAYGVGTIPQTSLGLIGDPVKAEFGIGTDLRLLYGISIGYEDATITGSRMLQGRAPLDDVVTFAD